MKDVMAADPLVEELARLDKDQRREIIDAAQRERQRRIRLAVRKVRADLMPYWSDRKSAREIEAAVRGRRAVSDQAGRMFRAEVRRLLEEELGALEDMPGHARIRQLIQT